MMILVMNGRKNDAYGGATIDVVKKYIENQGEKR